MKYLSMFLVVLFLSCSSIAVAQQASDLGWYPQESVMNQVVPSDYATIAGTATFLGPLANSQRTYQLLIHESLLTPLVGKEIHGFSMRTPVSATDPWPAADVTITNYDVYLSESVPPADRDLTFANNVVGTQTQVRSGSLIIPAGSYPSGSIPNNFGPDIAFNTLYPYDGGHLLIEIRHQGFSGTSRSTDALGTSTTGYGSLFSACWTGNYAGTSGSQGNFTIVKLTYDDPIPVELTAFYANVTGNVVELKWTTASEINNMGFDVERKSENSSYSVAGFVGGAATTSEIRHYSFTDIQQTSGVYTYRLKQLDFDGSYEYSFEIEVEVDVPSVYSLEQNYPTPFNPSTEIRFSLADAGNVKLTVYNLLGQEVSTLINGFKEAGTHTVNFDASGLTSGAYFYKIETPFFNQTKKMILSK